MGMISGSPGPGKVKTSVAAPRNGRQSWPSRRPDGAAFLLGVAHFDPQPPWQNIDRQFVDSVLGPDLDLSVGVDGQGLFRPNLKCATLRNVDFRMAPWHSAHRATE